MTETNMERDEITVFQQSIETCADPAEIVRKVKLAFKKMPGEMALACFAKVMTAELPHPVKVAVWDTVRYSHIWWGVDAVLQGAVMENPGVPGRSTAMASILWRSIREVKSYFIADAPYLFLFIIKRTDSFFNLRPKENVEN